ncbi:MAG: hypothetical protein II669_05630, partial [Elusimicrobia bacterium]|nr:hypothetical protein [Elusimicrobiota bacterium]
KSRAETTPEKLAIIENGRILSFEQLYKRINSAAAFFSEKGILCKKATLCRIGVTCTLVSSISSIINLIIQEEFKKNLTSSILGCLKCVIDLFLSFIVVKQSTHV